MRIELPILSIISLPLLLLPLPWHIRAGNVAIVSLVGVLFLLNLIRGTNAIIWDSNVIIRDVVYCDIATKFVVGSATALSACCLCITMHLEHVSSVRQTLQNASDKRKRQIREFVLCIVVPIIVMALHYIVQGHRFDILEDFGCNPTLYYSWPAILIVYVPSYLFSGLSIVYATMAFVWFMKRRAQFSEHLSSTRSGFNNSRYFRLMALAIAQILLSDGYGVYLFAVAQKEMPLRVYDNWANVHYNFSRIAQYPKVLIPDDFWNHTAMAWYGAPLGSFIFFAFFGFGEESRVEYGRAIRWIRVHVFRQTVVESSEHILPTYSAPSRHRVVRVGLDNDSINEKWDEGGRGDVSTARSVTDRLSIISDIPSSFDDVPHLQRGDDDEEKAIQTPVKAHLPKD